MQEQQDEPDGPPPLRSAQPRLRRWLRLAALALFSLVLLAPPAAVVHASEQKKSQVKKRQTRAVASRRGKSVAQLRPLRASAKSAATPARLRARARLVAAAPPRPSFGQLAGLHGASDPLGLQSSVALVMDQETHAVLLHKNDQAVLPIASLTKLMTGLLISSAKLPLAEPLTITQDDVDTEKNSRSRLAVGSRLTRGELLHLALMASENRAAHALGRTWPGGLEAFVAQMNAQARLLGMSSTRYVDPTGLSSQNQSSAHDLARLVDVAHGDPLLRELSTSPAYAVAVGNRTYQFNNTNRLVKNPDWDIGLQKTGYITEAGRCLVMQAQVAGRKLIMVFLDSAGKFSRLADADRVRHWVEEESRTLPAAALQTLPGKQG